MNSHNIAAGNSDSGEHLSIDVNMDGGVDVKMECVVVFPTKDMVMVDVNEGVNDTIKFAVQDGMVAKNIFE